MAAISTITFVPGYGDSTVSGRTIVSITNPYDQRPAPTAVHTARRWTCSDRSASGRLPEAACSRALGVAVGMCGSMILGLAMCHLHH